MGEVVRLQKPTKSGSKGSGKQARRPRRSKTALVLGGGGFTGGVYEIGALRALDLLAVNRTVNQFDVYVGTSAGSFVASLVANGVTPEEMMRVVNQQVPTPFRDVDRSTLMRPNAQGVRAERRAAAAPPPGPGPQLRRARSAPLRSSTWPWGWPRRCPRGSTTAAGSRDTSRPCSATPTA